MTKKILLLIAIIALAYGVKAQDETEIKNVIDNIERVFHSDSGQLILDLNKIPESILKRIEFIHDSIDNVHLNSYGSKPKEEVYKEFNEKTKSHRFIADKSDKWRRGDVITEENGNLPTRKFLLAISKENEMVLAYWHGGIGTHLHMFYIHLNAVNILTGFVTINNYEVFYKYASKNKLDKIRTVDLINLVDADGLRVFRGHVVYPLDEI